jgi:hypothetical protein
MKTKLDALVEEQEAARLKKLEASIERLSAETGVMKTRPEWRKRILASSRGV